MKTYLISVEKTVSREILVEADSLVEAKEKALRQSRAETREHAPADTHTNVICKQFWPFELKSA